MTTGYSAQQAASEAEVYSIVSTAYYFVPVEMKSTAISVSVCLFVWLFVSFVRPITYLK